MTLEITVGLSNASPPLTPSGFGDLYYCSVGDSLSGIKVRQILAAAETALGGGALPNGYTLGTLNDLVNNLNANSFDDCAVVAVTTLHLSRTTCQ